MRPVFERIALNGILTATILGAMGYLYAEMAAVWLAGGSGQRKVRNEDKASTISSGTISSSPEPLRPCHKFG